jgi:hypothetical protein
VLNPAERQSRVERRRRAENKASEEKNQKQKEVV